MKMRARFFAGACLLLVACSRRSPPPPLDENWSVVIPLCTMSKSVTRHNESKSGCFSTGKHDGFIYWERYVIAHDKVFSLRFQYAESLKSTMDPIVTHVNASWKQ
jgi:hypothetical protein